VIELAKWGNNLNQIAKHLNTNKGAWDRLGLEQLIEISNQLEQLRSKYVS
ncbi:plasmid mobilization relaxosome protein MobC, partial [Helicobacter pylori]